MKRYILRGFYRGRHGERIQADFIVTDPHFTEHGIFATHQTAWGGEIRQFHPHHQILDFYEEGTK